jgi:hypothetical protein
VGGWLGLQFFEESNKVGSGGEAPAAWDDPMQRRLLVVDGREVRNLLSIVNGEKVIDGYQGARPRCPGRAGSGQDGTGDSHRPK